MPSVNTSSSRLFSFARLELIGNALVIAVNNGGLSIAGVGLLAASTAALPFGLLAYHLYLIWAGMTTNESQKWSDWKEDMADGFVFLATKERLRAHHQRQLQQKSLFGDGASSHGASSNPALFDFDGGNDDRGAAAEWPVKTEQVLVRTNDGKPPRGQDGLWERVWSLDHVDNIYDLGGLQNFVEVLRGR